MKTKKILLIIILGLIITSCTQNKNEYQDLFEKYEETIKTEISDINNISITHLEESYNYLKENYANTTDENKEEIIYHIEYLLTISSYNTSNDLYLLSSTIKNNIETNSNETEEIENLINDIDKNSEIIFSNTYYSYHTTYTIPNIITNTTSTVEGDLNDINMINEKNINKAINYINAHYKNPLENNETIEKIIYYSLYLQNLASEDNIIIRLGNNSLTYLKTLSEDDETTLTTTLKEIINNQDELVANLYNELTN